jgi:hypothetical protein
MASAGALELPADGHFVAGPEPRLRLIRRHPLWSTGRRWAFGLALAVLTLPVAFPTLDGRPAHLLLFVLGMLIWPQDLSRLFVSHERRTGFRPVRRELWIRGAPGDRATVVVDGDDLGDARQAEVRVFDAIVEKVPLRSVVIRHAFTLAVVLDRRVYELLQTSDKASVDRLATGLVSAIPRPSSVITKSVGRTEVPGETVPALLSLWVPLLASGAGQRFGHVAAGDPRYVAIGVAALLARASVGVLRLTQAASAQEDKDFSRRFGGAVPALPRSRLSRRAGLAICLGAHGLLALAVAALAWRR